MRRASGLRMVDEAKKELARLRSIYRGPPLLPLDYTAHFHPTTYDVPIEHHYGEFVFTNGEHVSVLQSIVAQYQLILERA